MEKRYINIILVIGLIICLFEGSNAQINGLVKTGFNIGTINQEWWTYEDTIKYEKPLIRPIISIGGQYIFSKNWIIRQELMFQIKGQGTVRPDVRSLFQTENPDILRFISFPFSIHRKLISNIYFGIGIQPSYYISGSDNYYAKEGWHGWIYGGNLNLQYYIKDFLELGFEYDHDFTLYYCPGCDVRFYTYRLYGAYHFLGK
jgi:hypothetical protein